jgi:hypothetical protein
VLLKADQRISAVAPAGGVIYEEVLVGYAKHPIGDNAPPA